MGRWDDDDGWGYYETRPPRKVANGIKAKSERGAIGETWWSKRWVGVLESFSLGTRLTRGRSYARKGQVVSMTIERGIVNAQVQGSAPKPYKVKIELALLSEQNWERVTEAMAAQAIFAAKLLAGEMPQNIEEAFEAAKVSLFPTRLADLVTRCSCPDDANPCKHIAAVYYLLAERFDEDPFLLFKLRGRTKEQIIAALRERRIATLAPESTTVTPNAETPTADEGPPLEERVEDFWRASEELEAFTVHPFAPRIDKAVLKRLGDGPFAVEDRNISAMLARAYDIVDIQVRIIKELEL